MPRTILAIDAATVTGWAFGAIGSKPLGGAVRLGGEDTCDEDVWFDGMKFMNDRLGALNPDVVAIEAPMQGGKSSQSAIGRLLGLQAILRTVVRARRPNLAKLVHVQSARKFFIGRGDYGGQEAKARVQRRCVDLGWATWDDGHDFTDALCVWAKAAADADRDFAANFTELARAAA